MKRLLWMTAAVIAIGCGGGGKKKAAESGPASGSATAEDAIKGFLAAMNAGDPDKSASYFPSDALLAESMDCANGGKVIAEVQRSREGAREDATDIKKEGGSIEFVSANKLNERVLEKGQGAEDCLLKQSVTVAEYEITFKMSKQGKSRDKTVKKPLAKLGTGWFVVKD